MIRYCRPYHSKQRECADSHASWMPHNKEYKGYEIEFA
jgi:hypothetical protein